MQAISDSNSKQLIFLQILRGLAAISVMMFHLFIYFDKQNTILGSIFSKGYLGVDLFFFISGYVIYMTLQNRSGIQFWKARFFRLFPLYWFSLIFILGLQYFGKSSRLWDGSCLKSDQIENFIVNFTMLQSFLGFEDLDGAAWTLGVELNFYLIIFLIIFFVKKLRMQYFLLFILLIITVIYKSDRIPFPFESFYMNFFAGRYLPLFFMGIFCYNFHKKVLSSFSVLLFMFSFILQLLIYYKHSGNIFHGSFLLIVIFLFFIGGSIIERILLVIPLILRRPFVLLGDISYSLYLLHGSLILYLSHILKTFKIYDFNLLAISSIIFVLLFSYGTYYFIEKPFIKLSINLS